MNYKAFKDKIRSSLKTDLPGKEAQLKMMPVPLKNEIELPDISSGTGHPSSVLIPLFPDENEEVNVVLTLRTDSIRHAGQISFPGGRSDPGEPLIETALRESEEEISLDRKSVEIVGSLTPLYLYRTDNRINPFVGLVDKKPELKRNPDEVEEIITVPLKRLYTGQDFRREEKHFEHNSFDVPYWDIHKVPLWGATAMILSELLEVYGRIVE